MPFQSVHVHRIILRCSACIDARALAARVRRQYPGKRHEAVALPRFDIRTCRKIGCSSSLRLRGTDGAPPPRRARWEARRLHELRGEPSRPSARRLHLVAVISSEHRHRGIATGLDRDLRDLSRRSRSLRRAACTRHNRSIPEVVKFPHGLILRHRRLAPCKLQLIPGH